LQDYATVTAPLGAAVIEEQRELAFFRSSHIKIGSTIYAAWPSYRRPDRPPALSEDARD
jgi:hypothetical protein